MKIYIIFTALLIILSFKSYSQIIFEKGYFINESNQKIDCLIKNVDWRINPTEFEYKISQDSDIKKESIHTIKEFGIYGVSRYISALVKIDRSSDNIRNMSSYRNPDFQEEKLFLKVLFEGKASLYFYESGNLKRFFYNINDSEIEQLVYKRYLINNNIALNNYFKQQLSLNLECQTIRLNDIEYLKYAKKDLVQFFIKYNECSGSNYINYEATEKKDSFNLSLRPGLNFSSLKMQNPKSESRDTDFGINLSLRLGTEAEFILPFNKNKWSITIEPTYQYFKSEKSKESTEVSGGIIVSKVNYKSLELPIGLRHYFYLNGGSKILANISYVFDFPNNSSVEFLRKDGSLYSELEIESSRSLALGIGYKFKDEYGLEIRYQPNREILGRYVYWDSDYKVLSIILGYKLF